MRGFQLNELEKKQSDIETNTEKNTEAVRKQLQQFDDIFRMMLDIQKSYNALVPPAEQQRDEEWFADLDHNICSFKKKYIAG